MMIASSGAAFEVLAIGNSYDNFRFRLVDPSGKAVVDVFGTGGFLFLSPEKRWR